MTVSDGGGAAAALADDSRSTWVTFHHDDHPFFGFAEPTVGTGPNQIPPGAKVREGVLKAEARRSAAGDPLMFNWHMYDPQSGTNILGIRDDVGIPFLPNTFVVLTDVKKGNPHVNPSNILVDVYAHGSGSSPSVLFFALYFETIVVPRPTVTITNPVTTVTGDTTPPITWNSTLDADGGPQRYWHAKLYDTAADPDADTSSNESEEQEGGEASWTPEIALADDTWHAYVRVAQVVNGEKHWSAWAHQSFDVSIARPGVPTMTLTSEPNLARIKVLLTTNAGAATTTYYQTQFSDDGTDWFDAWTAQGDGRSTPSGNAATIYDYEAPNGGTRSYRSRALHAYPEGYATSAWTATQTSSWTSDDVWLKSLESPSLNLTVMTRGQPSATRAGRVGLFQPLGAKYPIAVMDKRSTAAGQFDFICTSDSERDAFEALMDAPGVILIQTPANIEDWPDRYCAIADYERERAFDRAYEPYSFESIQWTEVARPVP